MCNKKWWILYYWRESSSGAICPMHLCNASVQCILYVVQLKSRGWLICQRIELNPPHPLRMDCFGPFPIRRGRSEIKRCGLLFTCLCSRGVHIELLDDMTTDALINGPALFHSIRGAVRQIRCDQGSNFVGAKNEFATAMKELKPNRIASYLLERHCDFVFNAPCSSHVGGAWERQIRTVRNVLNSTLALCPGRLDDSSLRTLFYEAMVIVNTIIITTNDPMEEPLTPNHLITMKSALPLPPPGQFVKEDM